jgi:tRNA A37 threonylcarbamoyladenosine biosynthesis protein TsaE
VTILLWPIRSCQFARVSYFFVLIVLGIALIEWPSRLGRATPTNRLDISFRIHDDDTTNTNEEDDDAIMRHITVEAHGNQWLERLQRLVDDGYVDDLLLVEDELA